MIWLNGIKSIRSGVHWFRFPNRDWAECFVSWLLQLNRGLGRRVGGYVELLTNGDDLDLDGFFDSWHRRRIPLLLVTDATMHLACWEWDSIHSEWNYAGRDERGCFFRVFSGDGEGDREEFYLQDLVIGPPSETSALEDEFWSRP